MTLRVLTTALVALCSTSFISAQNDSLYSTIFIKPVGEILIESADDLEETDEPLLINEDIDNFQYILYFQGLDTVETENIIYSFSHLNDIVLDTISWDEITSDSDYDRIDDSAQISLGLFPFSETYQYSIQISNSDGIIIDENTETFTE